jgi:hypothetical protein
MENNAALRIKNYVAEHIRDPLTAADMLRDGRVLAVSRREDF